MSSKILKEAERVMTICNACRYCEGFCAVFPAMELRRTFTEKELKYMANLCHNCRGCYYACQYAPPHEFSLNVPKTLGLLRLETYKEAAWPEKASCFFKKNGWAVFAVTLICLALLVSIPLNFLGAEVFFSSHKGDFYKIIPYGLMVFPMVFVSMAVLMSLFKGVCSFITLTDADMSDLKDPKMHMKAVRDVLILKYLDGGGHGCNYPDDRFSMIRRWFHHSVFYGFFLCFLSTTIAAVYDHVLHLSAPYPFFSWPVITGALGGISLSIGTAGLLYLKTRMDREPATPEAFGMDIGFSSVLFFTAASGLLLLVLRATPLMGLLLTAHLGFVLSLFILMPYGKFVHAVYRYLALVRHEAEQNKNRL